MSDHSTIEDSDINLDMVPPNEMTLLKARAQTMGIVFSNNIGIAALRAKVAAKLNTVDEAEEPAVTQVAAVKAMTLRETLIADAMRLIRLRITNMDPKKKDVPGEIITTGNDFIGTVRKYIPFGEATDDGYHVPWCIYQVMEERKFLNITTKRAPNGREIYQNSWVREFSMEVLPPLTILEIQNLATAQAAAGVFNDDM